MGYGDDEGNGKDGSCGLLGRLGGLTLARKMRCGAARGGRRQCQDWERGKREESH